MGVDTTMIAQPTGYIYGLRLKGTENIRYVGLTTKTIAARLDGHKKLSRAGGSVPSSYWIRKHGEDNIEAVMIDECPLDVLGDRETFWIAKLGTRTTDGNGGLNVTAGGYGIVMEYQRTDAREKLFASRRAFTTEEVSEIRDLYATTHILMSDIVEAHGVGPSVVNKVIYNKGCYYDPEYTPPLGRRVKNASRVLLDSDIRFIREEYWSTKRTCVDIAKELGCTFDRVYDVVTNSSYYDPDYKPGKIEFRRVSTDASDETRAKMSASHLARWESMSETEKDRAVAHIKSDEGRKRQSESLKARIESGHTDVSSLGKSRAKWTNHKRWHLNRAKPNPECTLCDEADPSEFVVVETVLWSQTPEGKLKARENVARANHTKWHTNRDITKEGCVYCEQPNN